MEYVKLNDDITFSRIVQGLWRIDSWNLSDEELVAFVKDRIALGVTTFDTAEIYGNYEGEAIFGRVFELDPTLRSQIQLVTKTGINMASDKKDYLIGHYDTRYEKIISSCKQSIKNLNCEYIDTYLIHREDPCIDFHEVIRAMEDLKKEGLIKSYGVSNFDPIKFTSLNNVSNNSLVTNQIEVHPLCYEHFDSGMIDVLTEKRIHPMIWSPLAGGQIFTSKEEKFVTVRTKLEEIAKRHNTEADTIMYAWLMYHPVGMIPIVGSQKINRLKSAIKAFDVKLTHEEWFEIYTSGGKQLR
jgi:predicted oxidoreductase